MDNILYEEQLNNCNDLNELFELWKNEHKNEQDYENTTLMEKDEHKKIKFVEKTSFNKDGYIDENKYNELTTKKVLFVLKEANIWANRDNEEKIAPENREQINWYKEYIEENKNINKPKQHEKMGRMAFYLQNKTKDNAKFPTETEYKKALSSSAFMNMNKRGGKGNVTEKYNNYIKKYHKYIIKQIEIINPDYIIILGSNDRKIIKEIEKENKKKKIIYMWHTAYGMPKKERNKNPEYSKDQNVDCYMREFFKRVK